MQDLKGKIKIVAAAAAGTLMMGATMAGALAADLGQLPSPFVANSNFAGQVVVGANAAVPDVIAAAQLTAAFGEYLVSASSSATGASSAGFKEEDMALNSVVSTGLGKTTFTDTDIAGLIDTEISFRGDSYDVQEQVILGGSQPALVTGVDTSAMSGIQDGDTYGSDVGGKVYMSMAEDAVKYHYKFDDTLNATATSTEVDSTHPLEIKVLGTNLKITSVNQLLDKITVQLGTADVLGEGESMTTEGYTVTVDAIGSSSVSLSITGSGCTDSAFPAKDDTWSTGCGDIDVFIEDLLYVDANSPSNKVKIRAGDETTKTYADGDPYIGEDDDDPTWVWDIDTTDGVIGYVGVAYKPDVNSIDDDPIMMGEQITFPGDYLVLKLSQYNTENKGIYTFKFDSSEDIYAAGGDSSPIGALDNKPVFYVVGPADDSFSDGTNEAQKLAFSQDDDGAGNSTFYVAYWDTDNNKWVNGSARRNVGSVEDTAWDLKYQDSTYSVKVLFSAGAYTVELIDDGTTLDDIKMVLYNDTTAGFQYMGTTDNSADAAQLALASSNVGTVKSDILTHYGTVVKNPDSNGDSDKVVLEIPNEQVKAYVYLGAPTTGTVSTVGVTYTYSGLNAEVAVLDSEADTSGNTPLVIVGGPYANALAASLIGSDDATVKDFFGYDATANTGKGVVKLYDASATPWNVEAMVVAGWEAKDTRAAAYMLGQYMTGAKTLSNLDGLSEKKISATSATSYTEE